MTKVDFYILADNTIEQRQLFACRLAEKAFKLGHQIYIHSDNQTQADTLNQLLWSWRASSFIPHQLEQLTTDNDGMGKGGQRLQIGYRSADASASQHHDLMINLSSSVPEFFSRFKRVSEIVVQHDAITTATRANFRFYRDRGYPLKSHDLRK